MAKIFKAPQKWTQSANEVSLFLAGSIEMGKAEDWQTKLTDILKDSNLIILNPRRDDWDSSWEQSIKNKQFVEQVTWELDSQLRCDVICIYFDKETKSPISLLELGLFHDKPMIVFCPKEFYRKGNVDIVCRKYSIPVTEEFDEFVNSIKKELNKLEKTAMKKTALDPVDMTKPPTDEPAGEAPDLGGLDLGGDGGVDLGGGIGGANPLGGGLGGGNPLEDMAEGMSNEYYDSLKVTSTPDLEKEEAEDNTDDIDWSQIT